LRQFEIDIRLLVIQHAIGKTLSSCNIYTIKKMEQCLTPLFSFEGVYWYQILKRKRKMKGFSKILMKYVIIKSA